MKKKNTIRNVFYWLKDAGLKALVILLVVTAGFYAYAQITWPGADPNPTTGVVGIFVGATAEAYTAPQSYELVNAWCENHTDVNIAGSHVCTPAEMTNTYNNSNAASPVNNYTGPNILWVNSAAPGNVFPAVNDCNGWTDTGWTPFYGTVWNFGTKASAIQPCASAIALSFSCCK